MFIIHKSQIPKTMASKRFPTSKDVDVLMVEEEGKDPKPKVVSTNKVEVSAIYHSAGKRTGTNPRPRNMEPL